MADFDRPASVTSKRYLIDLSTSLAWEGRHAVGIVRTEREITRYFFSHVSQSGFFYFDRTTRKFRSVSRRRVHKLLHGTDAPKTEHPKEFYQGSLQTFSASDVVISAGLAWDNDFTAHLYAQKKDARFSVVQILYDIIPVIMPEYCVPEMKQRFLKYLMDVAWTADHVFCISDSTLADVDRFLGQVDVRKPVLKRIHLGSDVASGAISEPVADLDPDGFVLYVSTIEVRKNHQMLFNIWRELYDRHPDLLVPLVLVGGRGWNTDNLLSCIDLCGRLNRKYLKLTTSISDPQLTWLYRNSLFTVYPSLYEGWGLPVAESLAYGKHCVSSDSSSLPEAAAGFADLMHPLDYVAWRDRIAKLLGDRALIRSSEARIRAGFRARSWSSCMEQFARDVVVAPAIDRAA